MANWKEIGVKKYRDAKFHEREMPPVLAKRHMLISMQFVIPKGKLIDFKSSKIHFQFLQFYLHAKLFL